MLHGRVYPPIIIGVTTRAWECKCKSFFFHSKTGSEIITAFSGYFRAVWTGKWLYTRCGIKRVILPNYLYLIA
jgi:hypothetical protein